MDPELISCLCISQNKTDLVGISLTCFLNQSYPNKELIFVYEDNNKYIHDIKKKFRSNLIKYIEVPSIPKKTLGELRNISINKSNGSVLIQWDDDDIYHKDRIAVQYNYMNKTNTNAVILDERLLLIDNILYMTNIWPFEGSMIIRKKLFTEKIINMYPEENKGEDSKILVDLLKTNNVEFMHSPYLYLYCYHGNNVWDKGHFDEITRCSTILKSYHNKYNLLISELDNNSIIISKSKLNKKNIYKHLNNIIDITNIMNKKIQDLYILNTYGGNNPDEGLSVVYHAIKNLGIEVNNSVNIINKKVFIAGICFMYIKLLNKHNMNIIYTTYEFFPIPKLWVNTLNNYYSVVIVPHEEIKSIFVASGVIIPVYVVQQGCPIRKHSMTTQSINKKQLTIGFIGVPAKRKNLELLIRSIDLLRAKIPTVVLKVHISKYYRELKPIIFPKNNNFIISYGYKTDDELNKWYSSLDCYIFPSSGEGWSFTPRESLSLSIPTIISDCPVHRDLSDYCRMIPLPISVDNITTSIVDVYNNYNKYKKLAEKGGLYVLEHNTNNMMLNSLKNLIETL